MKNLGYVNGWKEIPEIVKQCRSQEHEIKEEKISRSVRKNTCLICSYEYLIDSGD